MNKKFLYRKQMKCPMKIRVRRVICRKQPGQLCPVFHLNGQHLIAAFHFYKVKQLVKLPVVGHNYVVVIIAVSLLLTGACRIRMQG